MGGKQELVQVNVTNDFKDMDQAIKNVLAMPENANRKEAGIYRTAISFAVLNSDEEIFRRIRAELARLVSEKTVKAQLAKEEARAERRSELMKLWNPQPQQQQKNPDAGTLDRTKSLISMSKHILFDLFDQARCVFFRILTAPANI